MNYDYVTVFRQTARCPLIFLCEVSFLQYKIKGKRFLKHCFKPLTNFGLLIGSRVLVSPSAFPYHDIHGCPLIKVRTAV